MAMKRELEVYIKKLRFKTPLMTASGTSGSSDELLKLKARDSMLESLGAFVTKGVTLKPREGNRAPRVYPTQSGLLNSIGLQNKGAVAFIAEELPRLLKYELPIIVNISANTIEEFGELAAYLIENDESRAISGIEINVSCPNIKEGGVIFGTNPKFVERIVKTVKKSVDDRIVIITKLTPNVTDITVPARAAIDGGTDALSMINTLRGMAIDIETGIPFLGNTYGGLSGPAIKPVGVYMVYECFDKIAECKNKKIPIIGVGGIATWRDAIEYIMAGATAVSIGTAWFVNNNIFVEVAEGMEKYLSERSKTINDLVGTAHDDEKVNECGI